MASDDVTAEAWAIAHRASLCGAGRERALLALIRRIQAEALEEAARVCDRLHGEWRAKSDRTYDAYHEGGADALDVAGQEVRALQRQYADGGPAPTDRETPRVCSCSFNPGEVRTVLDGLCGQCRLPLR